MKRLILLLLFFGCAETVNAEGNLIRLEMPITIQSNETFNGQGKTYESCGYPAFIMQGTGAVLENVRIEQCSGETVPAIQVSGLGHQLFDASIQSSGTGVLVENSYGVRIIRTTIVGDGTEEGIALLNSEAAELKGVVVKHVRDGIYIENGSRHSVIRPTISHSRYGIHLMFPTDVIITFPQLHHNATGAMIMGTEDVTLRHGQIHDQVGGSAMGLMLFEADGTTVELSDVSGNRTGIYAEKSEWTTLQRNTITSNEIGLRMKQANDMAILQNDVTGNRYPVTMNESADNIVQGNIWGGKTLDVTGDGLSELSFRADPYLFMLTDTYEAFELLYGSPGLVMLETILRSPDEAALIDPAPRTATFRWGWNGSIGTMVSITVLILIWILGRKRYEIV